MTEADVIAEYDAFIARFVARPRKATGGLPLCPFAVAARENGKIAYEVAPFAYERILARALEWSAVAGADETLVFLDPDRAFPLGDLYAMVHPLRVALEPLGWVVFTGHPDDQHRMGGIRTRQDPFPSIRIYGVEHLRSAEASLEAGGRYYAHLRQAELEDWEATLHDEEPDTA